MKKLLSIIVASFSVCGTASAKVPVQKLCAALADTAMIANKASAKGIPLNDMLSNYTDPVLSPEIQRMIHATVKAGYVDQKANQRPIQSYIMANDLCLMALSRN